jgi:hypothetical protein
MLKRARCSCPAAAFAAAICFCTSDAEDCARIRPQQKSRHAAVAKTIAVGLMFDLFIFGD